MSYAEGLLSHPGDNSNRDWIHIRYRRRVEPAANIDIFAGRPAGRGAHVGVGSTEATPMRPATDDPSNLSPHERLRELTAILANGIHRIRQIPPMGPKAGQIPAEFSPIGLDPGARTCPDGAVWTQRDKRRSMNAD
ncbi:MAG: hypothetical protein L6R00_20235 [Phycisphaerae bacterium]|nr:hypothetical protein [Phycisphaerae bacterium]